MFFKLKKKQFFLSKIHLRERSFENKMERLCVLLYSKYSPISNKMMDALTSCPVDLKMLVGLSPVCIDNESIRKQILKPNKIEIITVPCILIVYNTGNVEKYEGGSAFEWIEETVSKYMPPPPQQPPQQQPPPQQPPPQQPPPRVKSPKLQPRKQVQTRRQVQKVEIEDLEEEEEVVEENEYIEELPQKKFSQRRAKKETTMEELGIGNDNDKKSSSKAKDLMSAAMAMQKERDSSDTNTNKNPV